MKSGELLVALEDYELRASAAQAEAAASRPRRGWIVNANCWALWPRNNLRRRAPQRPPHSVNAKGANPCSSKASLVRHGLMRCAAPPRWPRRS